MLDEIIKQMGMACERRDKARDLNKTLNDLSALLVEDLTLQRKCQNLVSPAELLLTQLETEYNRVVTIYNKASKPPAP